MANAVVLDVRPFFERGEEPFSAIMDAVEALGPGEPLLLINSFEPVPLYGVMLKRGFGHRCEEKGPDEYHVLFSPL
jgi:uncharacterized protein (DUF2249 family)